MKLKYLILEEIVCGICVFSLSLNMYIEKIDVEKINFAVYNTFEIM